MKIFEMNYFMLFCKSYLFPIMTITAKEDDTNGIANVSITPVINIIISALQIDLQ